MPESSDSLSEIGKLSEQTFSASKYLLSLSAQNFAQSSFCFRELRQRFLLMVVFLRNSQFADEKVARLQLILVYFAYVFAFDFFQRF